jgi:hypothetical protein
MTFFERIHHVIDRLGADLRIVRTASEVALHAPLTTGRPVVFFNASTRISGLSLNAAFSLIASWAVRLAGMPVIHFVCDAGMSRCVLGTNQDDVYDPMPCRACVRQSRINTSNAKVHYFHYHQDEPLARDLEKLALGQLMKYEHPLADVTIPLGALVLPAMRWRLRVHNLQDDEPTRYLYREFILSAWNVASEFNAALNRIQPQACVIFNGQFFPEATARWLCLKHGVRAITHEVGLQPMTAYFTPGEATAYPINIPEGFELSAEQNAKLDEYLAQRFQGKFSMAGIQFWKEMRGLDEAFLKKASGFKQLVPVFTNVIFDTSQPHSNVVFSDMFGWLDAVLELVKAYPETLFAIRAHPDEMRPNSRKQSRETVAAWVAHTGAANLTNVVFYNSSEYVSSYELIQRAKFVMVYNSSIGLEASIMGSAVLCAGRARYTQYPTVFFPQSVEEFRSQAETFLRVDKIDTPADHRRQARRFLYYQLFRTSLPFEKFLMPFHRPGMVRFKSFGWEDLLPGTSPAIKAILDGLFRDGSFMLGND